MKDADSGTRLTEPAQREKPGTINNVRGKNYRDARGKPGKQQENQRELGVDQTHMTDDMKRKRRGTFP